MVEFKSFAIHLPLIQLKIKHHQSIVNHNPINISHHKCHHKSPNFLRNSHRSLEIRRGPHKSSEVLKNYQKCHPKCHHKCHHKSSEINPIIPLFLSFSPPRQEVHLPPRPTVRHQPLRSTTREHERSHCGADGPGSPWKTKIFIRCSTEKREKI